MIEQTLRERIEAIIYEKVEDGGVGTQEATTEILKLVIDKDIIRATITLIKEAVAEERNYLIKRKIFASLNVLQKRINL